jgi:hypothetical protein
MSADYIAFDRDFAQEYVLRVEVGQATAPDGATRVQVDGVGTLEAAQYRRGGEAPNVEPKNREQKEGEGEGERVTGKLAPDEAARLFEQASLAPWGRPFPQRPGIPDEAIVEVRFERARRGGATVKLWLRDAEKDVAVGPILAQLRRHLKELSGGRIYL